MATLHRRLRSVVRQNAFGCFDVIIPVSINCGVAVAESGQKADYDATGQRAAEALANAKRRRTSLRLLLVDSYDDLAFLMRKSLERAGHQVATCVTAAEVLLAVRGGNFDLITLAPVLPDGYGLDLLQALRREGVQTPAIMVGRNDPALISQALRAGVLDFVVFMDRISAFLAELPERVTKTARAGAARL